jgi:dipeptidyl aminopeptidase/acylaminoacyl peptidase
MSPRVRATAFAAAASLALAGHPAGARAQQPARIPAGSGVAPGAAAARRPVVAEDLYRLKNASDVAVSPDGRWVAYVVTRVDSAENRYARDIWLAAADGSQPRRLTFSDGSESAPAFAPDGRSLVFVAKRGNDAAPQLYLLSLAGGGEARRLTGLARGVAAPAWAPDGRRIAFISQLSPEELAKADSARLRGDSAAAAADSAGRRAGGPPRPGASRAERLAAAAAAGDPHLVTRLGFLAETGLAPERWGQLYVVGVEEGSKPVKLTSGAFPHLAPAWSADGRTIALAARPPKGSYEPDFEQDGDIWLVPADGSGAPRNLTGADAPPPGVKPLALPGAGRSAAWSESDPAWSPDGRRIAYVRTIVGAGESAANSEAVVRDLATGTVTCASCALDRAARGATWAEGGAALYFTVQDRGGVVLYRAAGNGTGARPVVSGARGVLSYDVAGSTLAWAEMNPADPAEVYAARADGGASRRLTRLNDELLAGLQVQPYEELGYAAPDGTRLQGWVVRPADFRPGMPLAVEMHGGPHAMWGPGEQSMWLEYETLAGDGYVVFFSNPRGSDGYGAAWKQAIHRNWGDLAMGDVLAGADSVIARGWADRNRQYLTGGSYAGFLTAWMVGPTGSRPPPPSAASTTWPPGTAPPTPGACTRASSTPSPGPIPSWPDRPRPSPTWSTCTRRCSSCTARRTGAWEWRARRCSSARSRCWAATWSSCATRGRATSSPARASPPTASTT